MPIPDFEDLNIDTPVVIGDWIDIDEVVGLRLKYGPWIIEKSKWNPDDYLRLQVEVNGKSRCIMGAYSILIKQCRAITTQGLSELYAVIEHFGNPEKQVETGDRRHRKGGKQDEPRGFYCFVKQPKGANNANIAGNAEGVPGQVLH